MPICRLSSGKSVTVRGAPPSTMPRTPFMRNDGGPPHLRQRLNPIGTSCLTDETILGECSMPGCTTSPSRAYPSVWPLLALRGKPGRRQGRLKAGRESGSKHGSRVRRRVADCDNLVRMGGSSPVTSQNQLFANRTDFGRGRDTDAARKLSDKCRFFFLSSFLEGGTPRAVVCTGSKPATTNILSTRTRRQDPIMHSI